MMYSKETLAKAVKMLTELIAYYISLPYETLHLHISRGNRKIGRVFNFSTAPIITCQNCSKCKKFCYDVKAVLMYASARLARAENTAMMLLNQQATFEQIDAFISRKHKRKFFRWHVAGEIMNKSYFAEMVQIAKKHPDWRFWTYTKVYWIVNQYIDENGRDAIPENLTIMFSVWNGVPCDNPHGLPTFTCIMEGMTPASDAVKCPGNCDKCIENKTGCAYGKSAYTLPH